MFKKILVHLPTSSTFVNKSRAGKREFNKTNNYKKSIFKYVNH